MLTINSNQSGTLENRYFKALDKSAKDELTKKNMLSAGQYQVDDHYYVVGVARNGVLFWDAGE